MAKGIAKMQGALGETSVHRESHQKVKAELTGVTAG